MAAAHCSLVHYFHQRWPTTYEPVGNIGRPFARGRGSGCCRRQWLAFQFGPARKRGQRDLEASASQKSPL